ncbi:MAG: hypothetical protein BJG00_001930 [Limnothrix sp. CACIAM 69d]|nr:MAG: hypothetical protein BJG00_001930 [Limnothrix sp. CACIAM 69d]
MLQLNEEVQNKLKTIAPLIAFFGLPELGQVAILPRLKERKYDFPEGDLITRSAIEVLVNAYNAHLNSISIRLLIVKDQSDSEDVKKLAISIDQLLEITNEIIDRYSFQKSNYSNCFKTTQWKRLCQISLEIQQALEIQLVVDTKTLENCIEYWLHP